MATNWTLWNTLAQWLTQHSDRTSTFWHKEGVFFCSLSYDNATAEGQAESMEKAAWIALQIHDLDMEERKKRAR